ncbi:hypothetical protein CCH79_00018700, partial [Gambusia affinis]
MLKPPALSSLCSSSSTHQPPPPPPSPGSEQSGRRVSHSPSHGKVPSSLAREGTGAPSSSTHQQWPRCMPLEERHYEERERNGHKNLFPADNVQNIQRLNQLTKRAGAQIWLLGDGRNTAGVPRCGHKRALEASGVTVGNVDVAVRLEDRQLQTPQDAVEKLATGDIKEGLKLTFSRSPKCEGCGPGRKGNAMMRIACRGLCSLGGGTQRSPLAQLRVYTPHGSPWAKTVVLLATSWSLGGRPAPRGSLQEGQTLKGPQRLPPAQDPQWAISSNTTAVKLERRGIFCSDEIRMNPEARTHTHPGVRIGHTLRTVSQLVLLLAVEKKETVTSVGRAELQFPKFRMDDINVLHHKCLLNLRRRIQDIGDGRAAQDRCMRLQKDGDTLSYQGNSEEVGCYVAGHPLSKGNCYFEVTIVDTGVRGTIAVGLVPRFYRLDHQPGWLPYSVAYHADNGKLYNGNPVGKQFGPKCARGDRIGCGIHSENTEAGLTTVFFTKNGREVGSIEVPVSCEGLYPAVGMHSMGEEVKVDLRAEWLLEEDDTMMMVDSHEDDWGRLHDVRVSGMLATLCAISPFLLRGDIWLAFHCVRAAHCEHEPAVPPPFVVTAVSLPTNLIPSAADERADNLHISISNNMKANGIIFDMLLEYVGKGKSIMDVGLAQARQPLTTRCHYYEVEIIDAGEKCYIALGLARRVSCQTRTFTVTGFSPRPVYSSTVRKAQIALRWDDLILEVLLHRAVDATQDCHSFAFQLPNRCRTGVGQIIPSTKAKA